MGNVQHLAHVAPLNSSYFQNTIPEWRKSRWCVSNKYDRMIIDSVSSAYESYDDLSEDLRFNLVMEISEKINAVEALDDFNKLSEEIKNGDYSEAEKTELRKIFKQKKAYLLQQINTEDNYENV